MATIPVGRLVVANAEFAQKMEQVFAALGTSNAISLDVNAAVAGMAIAWAATCNAAFESLNAQIATMDIRSKDAAAGDGRKEEKLYHIVNEKKGHDHIPEKWEGKNSKTPFKEVRKKVESWADAVYEKGIDILKYTETHSDEMTAKELRGIWIGKLDEGPDGESDTKNITQVAKELKEFA